MKKNTVKFLMLTLTLFLTSCLKTRSEVAETDQTAVYGKKNAGNQIETQTKNYVSQENSVQLTTVDEKDELIRSLNGRVEVLENQLTTLAKEKETDTAAKEQKLTLLQEALTKMEAQIHQLESDSAPKVGEKKNTALPSSDELEKNSKNVKKTDKKENTEKTVSKKTNSYEAAQEFFANSEWKKAILSFQKYTDESPKGKNVADAKYKIGVSFQELGMKEEAMAFYEEVVANYNSTEAGKKSKTRLAKLKK